MEKITFPQFGPVTRFDAAHVIDGHGRICAFVAEPEARDMVSESWDEETFRAALEAEIASWESRDAGERLWIQYDPGRDNATSVEVELRG